MEMNEELQPQNKSKFPSKKLLLVLLVISVCANFYLFFTKDSAQNLNKIQFEDNAKMIAEIGKLITLPEGETPTIATVSDLEKLSDQAFFANALLGDKVLIYTKARKAILYRPSEKKLIEVAELKLDL